jgi:hypothetical protein
VNTNTTEADAGNRYVWHVCARAAKGEATNAFIPDWPTAGRAGSKAHGGRGCQPGTVAKPGLPVPPGFVIDAAAR